MAFTADTGDHKVSRSDIFLVDPTALVVDWKKNLSRGGVKPPVDAALKELAHDMIPRKGPGEAEDGTSGQLNPILVRPLPDRRLEVVGGFRRMRAALWLIESGTCPDFKVKYVVSRMSDAEAALVNLQENLQREEPTPIQLAHAVRALTEDYGLSLAQVSGRIKKSQSWLGKLLNLVTLPAVIQESVAKGETPAKAAIEIAKLPGNEQVAAFNAVKDSGEKVTAARVKAAAPSAGPQGKSLAQVKKFLAARAGLSDPGRDVAKLLLRFIEGEIEYAEADNDWRALLPADPNPKKARATA